MNNGLKDRARALGWQDVVVIDDDLGRTASGTERLGFEQLLTAVCTNTAGAVFAIEASRLGPERPRLAHTFGVLWLGELPDHR
jgi:hypothetical protein